MLLDHLVCDGEKPWREAEAECSGGVEVDHELELARLHDRQVGRLLALGNPAGVDATLPLGPGKTRSLTLQTAAFGGLSKRIDPRHPLVGPQPNKLHAARRDP